MTPTLPVSLILTTLNEATTIESFLRSVAGQTAHPAEVVICDGGSNDGTSRRIEEIVPEFSFPVRIVNVPGATIASGRNAAIAAATCGIIAISDAGCTLHPGWLETITAPLVNDDSVGVIGGGYDFHATTRFEKLASAAEVPLHRLSPEIFLPSSRSFALRKRAWEEVGGYPEHLSFAGEDTAFCLALKRAGYGIHFVLEARVSWKPRPTFRSYLRQHFFYGVGDGESGSRDRFYRRTFFKWIVLVLSALAGIVFPWILLLWLAAVSLYMTRLSGTYEWNRFSPGFRLSAFGLLMSKELALMAGFLKGRLRHG